MKRDLYVGESKIAGKGVFTKRSFKRGKIIFIMKGKIYHKTNGNKKDTFSNPNWVGIDKNTWIDPDGIYQYLNHSCDPNTGIKGTVTFVALRDIRVGEELTIDYSVTEEDLNWMMKCSCGSKTCRKVVRSINYLNQKTIKRYLPFVPTYFKRVYSKK